MSEGRPPRTRGTPPSPAPPPASTAPASATPDVAAAGPAASPADLAQVPPLSLGRELARKAIHISSVAVPIAYAAGLRGTVVAGALAALLAAALVVEVARTRSTRAGAMFTRATGTLLRAHEHRRISGATWLLAAFLGSTLLFPRDVAVAAMCSVALGDAAAAIVGRWIGRRRLGARKSLEGSVACLAVVYLAARTVAGLGVAESLVGALCATLAEWPEGPLDDNVRMAGATGAGILLWRLAFS